MQPSTVEGAGMEPGLIAIIITLAIIIGAVKTRKCVECMLIGSIVAAVFAYKADFLGAWCQALQDMLADNVWVILVCGLFGGLIRLLQESKGSFGFSKYIAKVCDTDKKTLLMTYIMGMLIFVDDYLNVLSIGTCMKRLYDKRKLPRESLAFLLDSTGAPTCVLLPFSTWAVFYASLFIQQDSVKALGVSSGIEAYVKAIPFCFYPICALIVVFLYCIGVVPNLGEMKKAYRRAKDEGKPYSDASRKYNHDVQWGIEEDGNIWDFLIPMLILVGIAIFTGDILVAVVVALGVCFVLYVPRGVVSADDFLTLIVNGIGDMLPVLTMLVITFVLKEMCAELGMTEYIVSKCEALLFPAVFPAMTFILGALLAFTTGSDWGMSAVITPIVFPLGAQIGANVVLIMAAVISGGTFGSHACFYADATLLASQSAGIDNMEHALTQMPYVIISAVIAIVLFMVVGFVI